jgi:hypothetical protein
MFKQMKNIDSAFRYIRMVSLAFLLGCTCVSLFIANRSYQLALLSQQRIFILANGKALEAYSADRKIISGRSKRPCEDVPSFLLHA